MDPRFLKHVAGIPIRSTRGLILSKSYQPHYPLSTTSTKINGTDIKESFAAWIKNYASLGPKIIEIMKHKLNHGPKIIQFGSHGNIFRKKFSIREGEKLLHASRCFLYTTAGPIAGLLFVSTERVAFCSERSLKTYSNTGELLKFQYKVSIPIGKMKDIRESANLKKPSNNYVELETIDYFSFWFTGFRTYEKTLRYLHQAIDLDCLSTSC